MADILKKIKDVVSSNNEDEEYDDTYEKKTDEVIADMEVFDPKDFNECERIALVLKHQKSALVNIHKLSNDSAQRLLDYLSGATFALNGKIKQVSEDVFLITPKSMVVKGDVQQ